MPSTQDLMRLIASATANFDDSEGLKSTQEYARLIASCLEEDETTHELYLRVKSVDD